MVPLFKIKNDKAECLLCPHYCKLAKDKSGICGVRKNIGDKIELVTYGVISGYALDPIEKKPLYHFYPGYNILSIGSYGCNMRCDFCQNYHISQNIPKGLIPDATPDRIAENAQASLNNLGIAFTYNEPVIWFEFMRDVAVATKKRGLLTAMVSNGYITSEPLDELVELTDAFNIDLKAFNNDFYRKYTGTDIQPVKDALKQIARSGKHLEITTLIIPGRNDNQKEMALQVEWISGELGKKVPFHLSRYFPNYRRDDPVTSQEVLNRMYEIAAEKLDYVYIGNTVSDQGQNTKCPKCSLDVTERSGYKIRLTNLDKEGKCTGCGNLVYKYFTPSASSFS